MTPQNDTINEKAKRIEISLKYTGGEMDKAKLMASGKLQDITVIKGKFLIADKNCSGLILGFINVLNEYIAAIKVVMSGNNSIFSSVRIFDTWKSLYKNLIAYEAGDDSLDSGKISNDLLDSYISNDLFPDTQNKNLDFLSVAIQDIIKKSFGSEKVKCQFDLESTSSLDVELAGIDIMLPAPAEEQAATQPEPAAPVKSQAATAFQKRLEELESNATYIVEACCVLSPVRGKHINEIEKNERIYVVLSAKDPMSDRIIDAYRARGDDGQPLPIVGRVIEKIPNEEGKGYILYVLVAKGIYAKVIEEESVKIQTEASKAIMSGEDVEEGDSSKSKIFNIAIYVLFFLLVVAIVAILIMI